ncbi:putative E3 ubiquitin-protein ligase SINAT1 isoform X3 [Zingiber officinale]|uniref:putative E3 ubiquitin-protein ligase SINAT1 isoform X3 n=1 Tax=Zingiber officinale TaxID=94328 RepID=UPI001C4B3A5B|nr:putative E3 ubiquitin-protein ligase SINAT1 isoform X3 [Zingiber officinale]
MRPPSHELCDLRRPPSLSPCTHNGEVAPLVAKGEIARPQHPRRTRPKVITRECPSGHTLCFSYKNKVNKCPICRKEIGKIRCLALGKLAASLHLPCSYHHLGCTEMMPYYSKLQHKTHCVY